MTDYSEEGAVPVDDAAVDDPPTVDEVIEAQAERYPEQARTADGRPGEPPEGDRRPVGDDARQVTFLLPEHVDATTIAVAGDFNEWSHDALMMERDESGRWAATTELPTGRHHYRYLVDGERWENDWHADDYAPNQYGGDDSVIIVE